MFSHPLNKRSHKAREMNKVEPFDKSKELIEIHLLLVINLDGKIF